MGIAVRYGNYVHADGEAEFSLTRQLLLTEAETPYAERVQIQMQGWLLGNGTADLDQRVTALSAAYSVDNLDWVLVQNGDTNLAMSLFNANTVGGVRVTQRPSFPENRGAVYATYVPYAITLEAEVRVQGLATGLRSFSEHISFRGGGPKAGHLETRVGLPHPQTFTKSQIYHAVQEGQAVGLYGAPSAPAPIWPANLTQNPDVQRSGGRLKGSGSTAVYVDYGIHWRYVFESRFPLIGNPNNWGS